jgi:hypothetical protein
MSFLDEGGEGFKICNHNYEREYVQDSARIHKLICYNTSRDTHLIDTVIEKSNAHFSVNPKIVGSYLKCSRCHIHVCNDCGLIK